MKTVEFETELKGGRSLTIPAGVVHSLPANGKATVFVCVDFDPEDQEWLKASCGQFLRDDTCEDSIYDKYR